ncbi:alanine--tRNA ligase [Candidatus Woesearchaeota archaeon]|nr:alanine--tRNA ligase [Candidatus Woesearchaeota archaeon]
MDAPQLIKKYLDFFKSKKHAIIPSASLIPANDASVLFNTAGMQPLVPYLMRTPHPLGKRLANVQKCLRTVDFENIGDNTHHTFFQMLGNWSLGDYFKKEAISWSLEFLTAKKWLNIPLKKLAVTVYQGDAFVPRDEESYAFWRSLGIPEERIAFVGKDNFWIAGETGPCGPSSEMFYWTGEKAAPKKFDPADNRWVEIWNDVFMAYDKRANGTVAPLKQQNVDTGMGLERTLAMLTGQKSAYETDLFQPIIKKIEELSKKKYAKEIRAMRIIADHIRAATFILGDEQAVLPSNMDRGYVLRRLIRRVVRYGKLLGITQHFTRALAEIVVQQYGNLYPELAKNKARIYAELQKEEEKFEQTLDRGLREFEKMAAHGNLSGKDAFLLFQSYGFPLEMTEELAAEKKITIDVKSFLQEYERHQQLSRVGAEQKFKGGLADTSEIVVRMHTATHLLNEALRRMLSKDIHQRGSNITAERLRFDFNFPRKLTPEEVKRVEDEVNRVITLNLPVVRKEMAYKDALKMGAEAEFGQKYPERVSVYIVGDYSQELCGGPHVKSTKEIGRFKIVKEEACAAGVRRIKAVVEER